MRLPRPLVKICSLREIEHAEYVIAAGADAGGLIFAEARRRVSPERASEIVRELRRLDGSRPMIVVGVFVDQTASVVNRIVEQVGLDVVQLHGSERPDDVIPIERPVIKAVRVMPGQTATEMLSSLEGFESLACPPAAYLVDGYSEGAAGGTGERADWAVAASLATSTRLILAGGLSPENVGEAIAAVQPSGVDVSSGVETDGAKDRDKIIALVAAARAAFSSLDTRD